MKAGPKDIIHWKDHRSAKESAKSWFRDDIAKLPIEIESIIENNGNFDLITVNEVKPEALLHFDKFSGPCNMDVLVKATDKYGDFIIGIEAKADEPFSHYVKDVLSDALESKIDTPNTNKIIRIEQLTQSLFSKRRKKESKIGELRYQLLTGLAGTIAEANRHNIDRAVFLIHEFISHLTKSDKRNLNQLDLNQFIKRLTGGEIDRIEKGFLYGPIEIPGVPLFGKIPNIFIRKVSVTIN